MANASAGGIVVGKNGKMVLVEQHGNSWSFPKGGIEKGESPLEAAIREIGEETGLKNITCLGELGTYERYSINKDGTGEMFGLGLRARTIFVFVTNESELVVDGYEETKAQWVSFAEAEALLSHPKDKDFLKSSYKKLYTLLQETGIRLN